MSLRIGSLFAGIGGLELGLEWAGLGETIWQIEKEPFCRAILAKHWPHAERFDDVCTVGAANLAPVDLICGGFPCQDVSTAGKGAGLAGERSGLWREFARVVAELRPSWVVVENVAGGARRWLDAVVRELEQLGYGCLPVPLSASDVGAPHRRARVFVVAHADCGGELQPAGSECEQRRWSANGAFADVARLASGSDSGPQRDEARGHAADAKCDGVRLEQGRSGGQAGARTPEPPYPREGHAGWDVESGLVPLVYGLSGGLAGRRRRARIRALGNAVVPQQAEVVGWVIRELMAGAAS